MYALVKCLCFLIFTLLSISVVADDNWPQFRGHRASGLGSGNPPANWNIETGENIKWKTKIEGLGHSSPIIWGNRVYTTTAVSESLDKPTLQTGWLGGTGKAAEDRGKWVWQVMCHDLDSGERLWKKDVRSGLPVIKRHLKATHANCTPATDGKHLVAFFGSEGLYCFDMDGEIIWQKDLGRLHSGPYNAKELEWGFASSPVIHDGHVVVQCDCLNTKFVALFDLETGKEIRRIERDDVATWSTPAVISDGGEAQIVCNGYKQMAGYDFNTGRMLWKISGGGDVPVPTPLFANGKVFITNAHGGPSPTYAILPSARGDLTPKSGNSADSEQDKDTNEEVKQTEPTSQELPKGLVWWQPKDGSYMPTPIIVGSLLYTCNDNGRLAVRRIETGELVYRQRVATGSGTFSASAVATKEHLYFTNEAGKVFVVRPGEEYELIAENKMNETVMATPAISGDRLLIRTVSQLVCIAQD